ncbi:hypothetical protein Gpo141_00002227 [Globisporangium polare]
MYLPDYNFAVRDFKMPKLVDDAWVTNLNSEFKQLFVQSWFDLSMRALFALSLLMSLDDVKLFAAASAADTKSRSMTPPSAASSAVKASWKFEKLVHAGLVVWSCVIMALHFSSVGDEAELLDCMVRVRPWLATKPTCIAIQIDCVNHLGMVGARAELETRWAPLDASEIQMLIIRKCPELRMPSSVRSFPCLMGLYLYDSSLLEWSEMQRCREYTIQTCGRSRSSGSTWERLATHSTVFRQVFSLAISHRR